MGALQGAVDRDRRRFEHRGGFAGREAEHVAEYQHGALSRGQVLECRDEGELDALALLAWSLLDTYEPQILIRVAGANPVMRPLQYQTWETFSVNWNTDVKIAFSWLREALLKPLPPGSMVVVVSSGAAIGPRVPAHRRRAAEAALNIRRPGFAAAGARHLPLCVGQFLSLVHDDVRERAGELVRIGTGQCGLIDQGVLEVLAAQHRHQTYAVFVVRGLDQVVDDPGHLLAFSGDRGVMPALTS